MKTIVFDLDGTLVDSLPDIISSFRYSFTELGLKPPSPEVVRPYVGRPLEEMFAVFAPEQVTELAAVYRRHYPQHFTDSTRPYPEVQEALTTLRTRGYKTAVATTKATYMAQGLLEGLKLTPYLDHIQGTDGFPAKPAPDVIFRALEALGSEGVWMVGDTVHDVMAGKAAGLKTYAVTWGTHSREILAGAEPDRIEDSLTALLELLPTLN